jgi:riboflavin synthase
MFTGIVRAIGEVRASEMKNGSLVLTISKPASWDVKLGDSICTNGVCLTVSGLGSDCYEHVLVPETLTKTTFGLVVPTRVNLEQALRFGDAMNGHMVAGHVDTTGSITEIVSSGDCRRLTVAFPESFAHLVVMKGSVAIDGVSLTIADVKPGTLQVAVIPYTFQNTLLGNLRVGDPVNIEFDILGKHLARMAEK